MCQEFGVEKDDPTQESGVVNTVPTRTKPGKLISDTLIDGSSHASAPMRNPVAYQLNNDSGVWQAKCDVDNIFNTR